ncbi:MAG: hypothetical protein HKN43_09280 [Rhodothermales bacterium]|nr:hypothetical protein [Rhodothermales bacterium]
MKTTPLTKPVLGMSHEAKIKQAFERTAKALSLREFLGQGTAISRVSVKDGFSCTVTDGEWSLSVDMGEKDGGSNTGPNPGVLGRAALGTCLAMGYVRWAAVLGVPVDSIDVEIQADYDARGEYAVSDISPTYSEIRYVVTIVSDAPEAELIAMLDKSDKFSSFLAAFRDPQSVKRELSIVRSVEA